MGKRARMRPERLAEKLRQIRLALGVSQAEMLMRLGFDDVFEYRRISEYELGKIEPPLAVLLAYARDVNVSTDVLIDDQMDLPDKLPARTKRS